MTEIEKAVAACRKAFPNPRNKAWIGKWAWCCHHSVRLEVLSDPPENRIIYILRHKKIGELVTRLNNFRPVSEMPERLSRLGAAKAKALKACNKFIDSHRFIPTKTALTYSRAYNLYHKAMKTYSISIAIGQAHSKDVPKHTWNGKNIFQQP